VGFLPVYPTGTHQLRDLVELVTGPLNWSHYSQRMNPSGEWTALDSFTVTNPGSYVISTEQATTIVPTVPDQLSETENPDVSTKVRIAGAIVVACIGLLGALGIYLFRNGRKHDGTLIPFSEAKTGPVPSNQAMGHMVSLYTYLLSVS